MSLFTFLCSLPHCISPDSSRYQVAPWDFVSNYLKIFTRILFFFFFSFDTIHFLLSLQDWSKSEKNRVSKWVRVMLMMMKKTQQIVLIVGISFTKSQSCQFILFLLLVQSQLTLQVQSIWFSITLVTISFLLSSLSSFHLRSDLILFHLTESMNTERIRKKTQHLI